MKRLLVALLLLAPAARAQTSHSSVTCGIGVTPLDFGRYAPGAMLPADFSATITVTCTTVQEATVAMLGTVALNGGAPGTRRLSGPQGGLRYQLFSEPTRTIVWGDGSAGSVAVPLSGLVSRARPLRLTLTIYGRLLARQLGARTGAFHDQVAVFFTY